MLKKQKKNGFLINGARYYSNKLETHPNVRVSLSDNNRGMVIARMEFSRSVDLGSSTFVYSEIIKVVLIHFVPYISGLAKMTIVPSVKSSTAGYTFDYALGDVRQ